MLPISKHSYSCNGSLFCQLSWDIVSNRVLRGWVPVDSAKGVPLCPTIHFCSYDTGQYSYYAIHQNILLDTIEMGIFLDGLLRI